jgi:hypothetical protein
MAEARLLVGAPPQAENAVVHQTAGNFWRRGRGFVVLTRGHTTGDRVTGLTATELSAFGEDTRGRIYAVSLAGPVYRLVER